MYINYITLQSQLLIFVPSPVPFLFNQAPCKLKASSKLMKEPSVPTPLPLPPPPLETTMVHLPMRRRIRHTTATSTTTTSSQSSSLSSSPMSSLSPSSTSSSSIPFSWEQQPGIPKNSNPFETLALPLPLPPSRHSTGTITSTNPKSASGTGSKPISDPFVTALSQCSKEGLECVPAGTVARAQRRSKAARPMSLPAVTGRFGILDLYGCKTAISVVDAAVSLPQTGRRVGSYRIISRQTDQRRGDKNRKTSI